MPGSLGIQPQSELISFSFWITFTLLCACETGRIDHTVEYVLITHEQRTSECSLLVMYFRLLESHTHFHGTYTRGSHIRIACRSICDRDQNGIKQLTLFLGADQGIKTNYE